MARYLIEMVVPDEIDPSSLLERLQELAIELTEEADEDEVGFDEELIRSEVSVQPADEGRIGLEAVS